MGIYRVKCQYETEGDAEGEATGDIFEMEIEARDEDEAQDIAVEEDTADHFVILDVTLISP